MAPRFTVLLPTHDRADVVGIAIESVLAQSERDFELLVVGDGCSDGTADVVGSFGDERIRWLDLPKAPGFGYANRNLALHGARGELVAFMAHDDILFPDHLELMGRAFNDPGVDWAYSRPLWMDDDGTAVPFAVDLRRPDAFSFFMEVGNSIPASCVVHRRDCLERFGYWPEDVARAGDLVLWRRMVGASGGANLAYVPTVTCLHFRAAWRTGTEWGPTALTVWERSAATEWWPAPLRLRVPPGLSPQAHVWRTIKADPAWTGRVRDAVVDVIDGFAWGSVRQRRLLEEALGRAERLRAGHDRQAAQLAAARNLNATVLGSTSWRVTGPARALGRALRRLLA